MRLILEEKHHLITDVWAFIFRPEEPLKWNPGQYMRFELPHAKPDSKGIERWFTISSAPYEDVVQITTRVSNSTFKQALNTMPINGIIVGDSVEGDFVWHDDKEIIFVAGGIGITPFHSVLKQRSHDNAPTKLQLIYANRDDAIIFKDELDAWVQQFPGLKIDYQIGKRLDLDLLKQLSPHLLQSLVYVSGAPQMVTDLGDQLIQAGLPKEGLLQDYLDGYTHETA